MKQSGRTNSIPNWLDNETRALVEDIIRTLTKRHTDVLGIVLYGSVARHEERSLDEPDPSDVDLLVVLDSDDPLVDVHQGDALAHTVGLAYMRHLDAPREVQVLFTSRALRQQWDPTFIENVARDGIVLYSRGPLPEPFAA